MSAYREGTLVNKAELIEALSRSSGRPEVRDRGARRGARRDPERRHQGRQGLDHRLRCLREARPRRPDRAQPAHRRVRQGEEDLGAGVPPGRELQGPGRRRPGAEGHQGRRCPAKKAAAAKKAAPAKAVKATTVRKAAPAKKATRAATSATPAARHRDRRAHGARPSRHRSTGRSEADRRRAVAGLPSERPVAALVRAVDARVDGAGRVGRRTAPSLRPSAVR